MLAIGGAALSTALVGMMMTGPSASADPPGNNGTVKIDAEAFDDHPNNEPHVGCIFQVDFYGFDEGDDLNADVTFQVWPPTGPMETVLEDDVFIGEDNNSGGGSQAGLDATETYQLHLSAYEAHPQQGFHVKLIVNADGSQGADTKHKVFWVTGCEDAPDRDSRPVGRATKQGLASTVGPRRHPTPEAGAGLSSGPNRRSDAVSAAVVAGIAYPSGRLGTGHRPILSGRPS